MNRREEDNQKADKMMSLLEELNSNDKKVLELEKKVLKVLQEIKAHEENNETHLEEHRFIRELIERERASKELRRAVTTKIVKNTAWWGILALLAGVWYVLIDNIKTAVSA